MADLASLTPPRAPRDPRREAAQHVAGASFPLFLLPALGAVLGVSLLRPFHAHAEVLILSLFVASLAWLGAIAIARTGAGDLRVVVGGAIALRLLALAGTPELSDDVFRYAWEGELVARGVSPYAFAPDAPEFEGLRAELPELYGRLNHTDVSAAYPPLAQGAFAALSAAFSAAFASGEIEGWRPVVPALRVLFALCDLLVLVPLVALLRRRRLPAGLAVVWGWSPLVALSFAGSGHLDSLGILLLCSALLLFERAAPRGPSTSARELAAPVLLAAATLVKVLPISAAPFMARGPGGGRRLAVFALAILLGFLPIVVLLEGGSRGLLRGLSEYGLRWESASLVYGPLEALLRGLGLSADESLLDVRRVGRALVLFVWVAIAALLWRRRAGPTAAAGVLIGAFLVLTPTLHPWYIAWVLPFVALAPRTPFLWLAASGVLLYSAPALLALEGRYEVPLPLRLLIAVPFFALLLLELRSARPTAAA